MSFHWSITNPAPPTYVGRFPGNPNPAWTPRVLRSDERCAKDTCLAWLTCSDGPCCTCSMCVRHSTRTALIGSAEDGGREPLKSGIHRKRRRRRWRRGRGRGTVCYTMYGSSVVFVRLYNEDYLFDRLEVRKHAYFAKRPIEQARSFGPAWTLPVRNDVTDALQRVDLGAKHPRSPGRVRVARKTTHAREGGGG